MHTSARPFEWAVFAAVVIGVMAIDIALLGKGGRHMSFREAVVRSLFNIAAGLLFGGFVWWRLGRDLAASYLVAYLVEESLSVDNLFVFLVIFSYFRLSDSRQHRVLAWGVAGAMVMRAIFIFAGAALLHRFHWLTYAFGAFLIYTGVKLAIRKEEAAVSPEDSPALKLARRFLRTTEEFNGDHFTIVKGGVRYATPLFLVLVVIEVTDLLFAVDSVPAVLAVSRDVFVVYTSNIMAILGLRALYFVLAGMMNRFHHLGTGLALILIFIGIKMAIAQFVPIPSLVSLAIIVTVLTGSIVLSLLRPPDRDTGAA
ncbi:MAG TPA: TerC family protein [Polyangiaceae bacterium]|nr:TerC family protein [Polyangiaceae bacterium]